MKGRKSGRLATIPMLALSPLSPLRPYASAIRGTWADPAAGGADSGGRERRAIGSPNEPPAVTGVAMIFPATETVKGTVLFGIRQEKSRTTGETFGRVPPMPAIPGAIAVADDVSSRVSVFNADSWECFAATFKTTSRDASARALGP